MQVKTRLLALLSSLMLLHISAGCGQNSPTDRPSASEYGPPWITLDENKFGSSSSGPFIKDGKPVLDENGVHIMRFSATNNEFVDLLEDICNHFEVSIRVRPQELCSRGISTEVTGATAQAALEDLAKQCKLQLEPIDEKKWRLSAPNSDSATEKTITYAPE